MLYFHLYERIASGLSWAGGGGTSIGAGIDGDETVFWGRGGCDSKILAEWDLPSRQA
jgi:hypothetical protein